jgi:DNA-binding MarR family transcriptional regulator
MSKNTSSSYIRFLNLINSMGSINGVKKPDAIGGQLLEAVMLANSEKQEILVGDLLKMSHIGSQATLHGRVKNLSKMGFFLLVTDTLDGRKKKVIPTKLATKYYENLSKLLAKAVLA